MNRQTHGADDGTRTRRGVATLWVLKTHVYTFSTTSASGKINRFFRSVIPSDFTEGFIFPSSSSSTCGDSLKTVTRWYL